MSAREPKRPTGPVGMEDMGRLQVLTRALYELLTPLDGDGDIRFGLEENEQTVAIDLAMIIRCEAEALYDRACKADKAAYEASKTAGVQ